MTKLPNIPESVRVGPFDIKIEQWDGHSGTTRNKFGEWSPVPLTISLDMSVHPIKVLDTLIHEINHAIFWCYDVGDGDKEERTIGVLATGWTQIYRDNPELLDFINQTVREEK